MSCVRFALKVALKDGEGVRVMGSAGDFSFIIQSDKYSYGTFDGKYHLINNNIIDSIYIIL